MLRTYDFRCHICEARRGPEDRAFDGDFSALVDIRDDGAFLFPACPVCESEENVTRIPSAPNVMRASWPEGHRRPDSWYISKEAERLRKESFRLPPKKREDVNKEIRTLESESHKRFRSET